MSMVSESMLRLLSVFRYTRVVYGFTELQRRTGISKPALSQAIERLRSIGVLEATGGRRASYSIVNQDVAWLADLLLRTVHGSGFESLISSWSREGVVMVVDVPLYLATLIYRSLDGLLSPGTTGGVLTTWETRVPTSLIFDVSAKATSDLAYEVFRAVEEMRKTEFRRRLVGSPDSPQQGGQGLGRWVKRGQPGRRSQ